MGAADYFCKGLNAIDVETMTGLPEQPAKARPTVGTAAPLVILTGQGHALEAEVIAVLQQFKEEQALVAFERTAISEKAITFDVVLTAEAWRSGARDRIHDAALDLQERFGVVVLFELRRERTLAERS